MITPFEPVHCTWQLSRVQATIETVTQGTDCWATPDATFLTDQGASIIFRDRRLPIISCARNLLNYLNVTILHRKAYYCNTTQSSNFQATVARKSKAGEHVGDHVLRDRRTTQLFTLIQSRREWPFLSRERPKYFLIDSVKRSTAISFS